MKNSFVLFLNWTTSKQVQFSGSVTETWATQGASWCLTSVSKLGRFLISKHINNLIFNSKFHAWRPRFIDKIVDWNFKEQWHHRNFPGLGYDRSLGRKFTSPIFICINQSSNFETVFSLLRSHWAPHWVQFQCLAGSCFANSAVYCLNIFEMKSEV